jgi:hypothetical protein
MQKVVGSSPIIRSSKPAGNGGFCVLRRRSGGELGPMSQLLVSSATIVSSEVPNTSSVPPAGDNDRRSPRKLLEAVVARLLSRNRTRATDPGTNERVAVVATLMPGSRERAAEIIAGGAPYGLRLAGFERHSVFLADEAVVFVFEGPEIEGLVRELVNDRASSAAFAVWAPLLQGTPVLAREEFYWQAGQSE